MVTGAHDVRSPEPRPICHGCSSDRVEMVLPASPEVLSYRCSNCQRQWSVRVSGRVNRS
ncbi:MAG: hypothetical protein ABI603_16560 [Acidobacteriota bacterium]